MSQPSSDLANRRAEIDRIDTEIHRLLRDRAKVVQGVLRAKKAATAAGEPTPPFRPGREADVLRKLVENHSGDFPTVSLLRIWREIVSGMTRIQAVQTIAVPDDFAQGWVLARDHFGMGADYAGAKCSSSAADMAAAETAAAAVVPVASASAGGLWWRDMISGNREKGALQVVARLPFFGERAGDGAIVLSAYAPDASQDDRGVIGLALESDDGVAQAMDVLRNEGLSVTAPPLQTPDAAYLEVASLLSGDAPILERLGALPSVSQATSLGGYAVPLQS